jgi:5-formyltetrahydrofolate cyclo-ligase
MGQTKAELRKAVLAKRNAASSEWRAMASADIGRRAMQHILTGPGGALAGYWPYKSEVDPRPALVDAKLYGRPLALPVIEHPDVIFRRWIPGVELIDAGFGTMGPDATADALRPAIVIVPLAAFDARCNRIGWGQGHYDRVIEKLLADGEPLLTIGFAFGFQQVEGVAVEPHDKPLDMIVTEEQVFKP